MADPSVLRAGLTKSKKRRIRAQRLCFCRGMKAASGPPGFFFKDVESHQTWNQAKLNLALLLPFLYGDEPDVVKVVSNTALTAMPESCLRRVVFFCGDRQTTHSVTSTSETYIMHPDALNIKVACKKLRQCQDAIALEAKSSFEAANLMSIDIVNTADELCEAEHTFKQGVDENPTLSNDGCWFGVSSSSQSHHHELTGDCDSAHTMAAETKTTAPESTVGNEEVRDAYRKVQLESHPTFPFLCWSDAERVRMVSSQHSALISFGEQPPASEAKCDQPENSPSPGRSSAGVKRIGTFASDVPVPESDNESAEDVKTAAPTKKKCSTFGSYDSYMYTLCGADSKGLSDKSCEALLRINTKLAARRSRIKQSDVTELHHMDLMIEYPLADQTDTEQACIMCLNEKERHERIEAIRRLHTDFRDSFLQYLEYGESSFTDEVEKDESARRRGWGWND